MEYEKWFYYKKGILSRSADYEEIHLSNKDARQLFHHFKSAYYIRYVSEFDNGNEGPMYDVIKDGDCDLEHLPPKTRNMVRKCLRYCEVKKVDYQRIVGDGGYDIYLKEISRYNNNGHVTLPQTREKWTHGKRESASRGEEYWGVYYRGDLIAYGIVAIKGAEANLVTWKCDYENYKSLYPSYGLVYSMTCHYLRQDGIRYINDGCRSLTEHSSVQSFLESKFHYRKAYVKLNVVFKWYFKVVVLVLAPFERHIKNINILAIIRLYKWSR